MGIENFDDDTGPSMGEYEYMYALCNDPDEFAGDRADERRYIRGVHEMAFGTSLDEVPAGKWKVRGGAVLEISKMTKPHLENAIKLFTRAGHADHMKIRELREELARRPK